MLVRACCCYSLVALRRPVVTSPRVAVRTASEASVAPAVPHCSPQSHSGPRSADPVCTPLSWCAVVHRCMTIRHGRGLRNRATQLLHRWPSRWRDSAALDTLRARKSYEEGMPRHRLQGRAQSTARGRAQVKPLRRFRTASASNDRAEPRQHSSPACEPKLDWNRAVAADCIGCITTDERRIPKARKEESE